MTIIHTFRYNDHLCEVCEHYQPYQGIGTPEESHPSVPITYLFINQTEHPMPPNCQGVYLQANLKAIEAAIVNKYADTILK